MTVGVPIFLEDVAFFLDVAPPTPTYERIGQGVANAAPAMNPEVTKEHWIHNTNASVEVENYSPDVSLTIKAYFGNEVFDYLYGLLIARSTGDAAKSTIVIARFWEAPTVLAYPAQQQAVAISFDNDLGGEAGTVAEIVCTFNYDGDPVEGDFDTGTNLFTPDP